MGHVVDNKDFAFGNQVATISSVASVLRTLYAYTFFENLECIYGRRKYVRPEKDG